MELNKTAPIVRFSEAEIDGEVMFQQLYSAFVDDIKPPNES